MTVIESRALGRAQDGKTVKWRAVDDKLLLGVGKKGGVYIFYTQLRGSNMTKEEFVIFDTEYTAWEGSRERNWSRPHEKRELIQIGAIKVARASGQYQEIGAFSVFIQPIFNPQLSRYVQDLTGILQSQVDAQGLNFKIALQQFFEFTHQGRLPVFC